MGDCKHNFTDFADCHRLCYHCDEYECDVLRKLLIEARRFVQDNANMMADISRFAPLSPEHQEQHDNTEYPSEILLRKIDEALKLEE